MRFEPASEIYVGVLGSGAISNYAAHMTDLAKAIRVKRKAAGLTQDELAKQLGTTQANVSRWEKGSEPKAENVRAVADWLGMSADAMIATYMQGLDANDAAGEGAFKAGEDLLFLPVVLPSGPRLMAMFRSMLVGHEKLSQDEIARRLAQGLADGLRQALGRPIGPETDESQFHSEGAQPLATQRPAPRS